MYWMMLLWKSGEAWGPYPILSQASSEFYLFLIIPEFVFLLSERSISNTHLQISSEKLEWNNIFKALSTLCNMHSVQGIMKEQLLVPVFPEAKEAPRCGFLLLLKHHILDILWLIKRILLCIKPWTTMRHSNRWGYSWWVLGIGLDCLPAFCGSYSWLML